ncbi:chemotaxis protein CheW [Herbinix luporum]|jgi:purine-binding chemotaxis protein CheW|uniref:CheW-like domain-containing protein n=1 Tax=Herbinix luporum TaxID=1679721 RepID=A0A0K8J8S1_9FIRM|nr:chemotaxis protein CheW [Herbinix luporum]MDI9487849.1 chemotaxis protein CheW [Bacillota bacterium]CUH93702.1 hypothetical protein SD1D_2187 [Herbinix luporum]HHT56589.1 hypothetical protein [Herbinix luporum]
METKLAVFLVDGEEYGLDIANINTVEKDFNIEYLPDSPKNVKGKIYLRGDEIPVYSLRSKFGIPEKERDKDTRLLISSVKGMPIALEVDKVNGIMDIETTDVFDLPQVIKNNNTSYIKYIAKSGGNLILLLDSDMLLDNEEINLLEELVNI